MHFLVATCEYSRRFSEPYAIWTRQRTKYNSLRESNIKTVLLCFGGQLIGYSEFGGGGVWAVAAGRFEMKPQERFIYFFCLSKFMTNTHSMRRIGLKKNNKKEKHVKEEDRLDVATETGRILELALDLPG